MPQGFGKCLNGGVAFVWIWIESAADDAIQGGRGFDDGMQAGKCADGTTAG